MKTWRIQHLDLLSSIRLKVERSLTVTVSDLSTLMGGADIIMAGAALVHC